MSFLFSLLLASAWLWMFVYDSLLLSQSGLAQVKLIHSIILPLLLLLLCAPYLSLIWASLSSLCPAGSQTGSINPLMVTAAAAAAPTNFQLKLHQSPVSGHFPRPRACKTDVAVFSGWLGVKMEMEINKKSARHFLWDLLPFESVTIINYWQHTVRRKTAGVGEASGQGGRQRRRGRKREKERVRENYRGLSMSTF